MKNILSKIKPEDFVIGIRPDMDENNVWTGEIHMSIVTDKNNPLNDDDYYSLLAFCKVICSSVPAMEEDDYIRKKLEDKATEFDEYTDAPQKKKGKVVDKQGNVVVLSFDAETKGNA